MSHGTTDPPLSSVRKFDLLRLQGFVPALAALLLVSAGLWHLRYHADYTLDDAYISFRYARNLVRGLGLVYNPGDYVKGYSNTLYTLLMSLPEWGGSDPIGLSKLLGAFAFVTVCALCFWHCTRGPQPSAAVLALLVLALLAGSPSIAVHFIGGLETGLHTALIVAAVLRRLHEQRVPSRPWSLLLFAGVVLGRPEGVLVFAAMALHDAGVRARARRVRVADLVFFVLPALVYGGELAWSAAYYGDPFPQTYYAKAGASAGELASGSILARNLLGQVRTGSYLSEGLRSAGFGLWWSLLAVVLALVPRARRRCSSAFAMVLLAQLVFVVRADHDWAPGFRFGVPLLPFLFLLVGEALGFLASLARGLQPWAATALALLALAVALPAQIEASRQIHDKPIVNAAGKLLQGKLLAGLVEPGLQLSTFDIGGHGYAAGGLDILDTVGLTVRETTRCKDRMIPRCTRYAALVMPELVRLHNNRRRDAYVSKTVRAQRPYLELDRGKYLLQRDRVLMAELPDWVGPREPRSFGRVELLAHDVPPALLPRAAAQISLFWRRASAAPPQLEARRLEWLGPAGHFNAQASDVLWKWTDVAAWRAGEVFADLVNIEASARAGRYELHVVSGGVRSVLSRVDVLSGSEAAARARQLVEAARVLLGQGRQSSAIRLLARASELDGPAARSVYQEVVVGTAQRSRAHAQQLEPADRVGALRLAQAAKVQLHRAYWQSGRATPRLRREIDANAALRRRLIDRELSGL